jgi:putative addiction module component (TIGR02574 family)
MEITMGIKDTVRALLNRMPDDCKLDEIIDRLYELEVPGGEASSAAPLTPAQRAELDRRLDLLEREPGRLIPWSEFRRELERDE